MLIIKKPCFIWKAGILWLETVITTTVLPSTPPCYAFQCILARIQTCLTLFPQGRHYNWTSFALNSKKRSILVWNVPSPLPSLTFKNFKITPVFASRGCGNHIEGNGTECAICLRAVVLRFYGNTPPVVTVTLLSSFSTNYSQKQSGPCTKGQQRWSHERESGEEGRLKSPIHSLSHLSYKANSKYRDFGDILVLFITSV